MGRMLAGLTFDTHCGCGSRYEEAIGPGREVWQMLDSTEEADA